MRHAVPRKREEEIGNSGERVEATIYKIFSPSSFSFNAYLLEVTLIKPFPNQLTREARISAQSVNFSPSEPSF